MAIRTQLLLDAVTSPTVSGAKAPRAAKRTFQATGATSAGAGAATVNVQASNDGVNWILIATISLVLSTTSATDGLASDAPWRYVRADLSALSGTDATVTVTMGD